MVRAVANLLLGLGALLVIAALVANVFALRGLLEAESRQLQCVGAGFVSLIAGALLSPASRARLRAWAAGSEPVAPGMCLRLTLWFALVLGLLEVGHVALRSYGFGLFVRKPPEIVWMVPLSYALLLLPAGLLLAAAARRWPAAITMPVVVFPLTLFAALSQCLFYPVQRVAVAILSVGIAVQVARAAAAHPRRLLTVHRRTWIALVVFVFAGFVGVSTWRTSSYWSALRALPPAPAGAPNVVLIVLDTVRQDHMSLNGYERETTPCLDRLAATSVVFDRAIAPCSWTLPSHASFFTGRYPNELHADWLTPLEPGPPTVAEILDAHGYVTGGFVGNLGYCQRETGLARGFLHYEDYHIEPAVFGYSSAVGQRLMYRFVGHDLNELIRNDAEVVTTGFVDWAAGVGGRPFFAFLNYYDAHAYYLPPPEYEGRFGPSSPHLRAWYGWRHDPAERQGFINAYDACIAAIDDQIQRLVDTLEARGQFDNTVIIVTSDHGELFWEHGLTEHGQCLYRPLLDMPLLIRDPRRPQGQRIAEAVSLRDLGATILDLTGVEPSTPFPGHSLARAWDPAAVAGPIDSPLFSYLGQGINTPPADPNTAGPMQSLFAEGLHYIRNGDGSEELYDVAADPGEERDLVEARPDAAARLRAEVDRMLASRGR